MNNKFIIDRIRGNLKNYIVDNGIKALVLGVSGGADSALVAAIARPVCDELGIKLIGRSIPIQTNKLDELERADMVGKAFCHDYKVEDLGELFDTMKVVCLKNGKTADERKEKIRGGNVKARMRMILLYDLAQANDGLVLSTDNYTELMVGFWTLHGDVGDLGMIQNYYKSEVYGMMKWLVENELKGDAAKAIQACIDAVPTDGLGITSSDLEQLGAKTYDEVDQVLKEFFAVKAILNYNNQPTPKAEIYKYAKDRLPELKKHPVVQRHLRTEFKRNNPYNFDRID